MSHSEKAPRRGANGGSDRVTEKPARLVDKGGDQYALQCEVCGGFKFFITVTTKYIDAPQVNLGCATCGGQGVMKFEPEG